MGTVYRALDRVSGAPVALKILASAHPKDAERFGREAEILRALEHPAIVRYVAHGATEDGVPFLAMDWLEGEDLDHRLARAPLSVTDALAAVRRAADALGAAHARGVIHRDIKPSNLYLVGRDLTKLTVLDFGLARVMHWTRATHAGSVLGTPGFMSPEQATGEATIDARTDVFALGCVLYECIAGRPAFTGENVLAILAKLMLANIGRLSDARSDIPAAVDDLLASMLARLPVDRLANGVAVAAAIDALEPRIRVPREPIARPIVLTARENRVVSIVLVDASLAPLSPPGASLSTPMDSSWPASASAPDEAIRATAAPFEGVARRLADGSVAAVLHATGSATDLAARAARCALALRGLFPRAAIALATGRGEMHDEIPVGDAIDRAARLVQLQQSPTAELVEPSRPVQIDDTTAGLLDATFEVGGSDAGLVLVGVRETIDGARTLLGRKSPFVGRERELAALARVLDVTMSKGTAHAVLVLGDVGIGKSRLRHEFVRAVIGRDEFVPVWFARADSLGSRSPFALLATLVRRTAGIQDGEPIEVRRRKLRARVARNVPVPDVARVTAFLGELVGVDAGRYDDTIIRGARANPIVMGDQIRRAWEEFLAAEAHSGPVLIVVEDLHLVDASSLTALDHARANLARLPWMIVGLARPEVLETFPSLWAGGAVEHIRLERLTDDACTALARRFLDESARPHVIEGVVARAAGNPFVLEEMVRAVARGRSDTLPESVLAVIAERIESLDGATRKLARAASVFGDHFWEGGVATLLGADASPDALRAALAKLDEREVIAPLAVSKFAGEREWVFRHSSVREAAYAMLTDDDRTLGHRLAASWLERSAERDVAVIAQHWEQSDRPAAAARWYEVAAQQALAGNDFGGAIERAERAVSLTADADAPPRLRVLQAEAHRWRGENLEAFAHAETAMGLAATGSDLWYAATGEFAIAAGILHRQAALARAGRELVTALARGALSGSAIVAAARAAVTMFHATALDVADSLVAAIERVLASPSGREWIERDPSLRARVFGLRSIAANHAGDVSAHIDLMDSAAHSYDESGDPRGACSARANVGFAYLEVGEYERARDCLRAALDTAETMRLAYVAALAAHNLGLALARTGNIDEARDVEFGAADSFRAQGNTRLEAASRNYLALIEVEAGDLERAEQEAMAAAQLLPRGQPVRAHALATLAFVILRRDPARSVEALQHADEAMETLRAVKMMDAGDAIIRLAYVEALRACGRNDDASQALADAREHLLARAATISIPARRESFLRRVPENARTLELAKS